MSEDTIPPEEPSDVFMRAVCDSGTPAQTCDLCGRLNFNLSGEFMEEGELDGYLAKQKAKPQAYFGQDNCISFGEIGGMTVVWGCPCNKARRYEDFIWLNRHAILAYLKALTDLRLASAQKDSTAVSSVSEI